MDMAMHCLVEESLLTACSNLGKNLLLQCLQQDVLALDGTVDALPGACQALAETILHSVQYRIWEDGCVTQKEILSYSCRELAKLIKAQCPRGPEEMERMQGRLESVLSEGSLAARLAEVINTRELVECVCSRHDTGLRTVLLSACRWLMNDIKTLFLCEEVWSNFFSDECMVRAAFYTQVRPLLSTMVFQINMASRREWTQYRDNVAQAYHNLKGNVDNFAKVKPNTSKRDPWNHNTFGMEAIERQRQLTLSHNDSCRSSHFSSKVSKKVIGGTKPHRRTQSSTDQVEYVEQREVININNRENQISYIIEIKSNECKTRYKTAIFYLWCLITKKDRFLYNNLCDERASYLITFGRHPVNTLDLLCFDSHEDNAFKSDVTVQGVGCPVWPKDKSVVKRWFPDYRDQLIEDVDDLGHQCLQIWRIGSKKMEKRYPKSKSIQVVERQMSSVTSQKGSSSATQKSTVGCFPFSKSKRNREDF